MALYDTNLTSGNILLDSGYAAQDPADLVAFHQAPNVALDWMRPVEPLDGDVDVPRGEAVRAHLLGDYGDNSSIAMEMNTEGLQINITTAPAGLYVDREPSERALEEDDISGDCEMHVEGTETTAGAQSLDWDFNLKAKSTLSGLAAGKIFIRQEQLGLVAGRVPIRQAAAGLAAGKITIRQLFELVGRAAGKVFVGEFFVQSDGSIAFNLAEENLGSDGSITVDVKGFRVQSDGSITVEIQGEQLKSGGSITFNVAVEAMNADGSITFNIGVLDVKSDGSITVNLWGEQTGYPSGRLIVRASSLPAALKQALLDAGIQFRT